MTEAAQQALRRTMENYSATTRFALACNTSGLSSLASGGFKSSRGDTERNFFHFFSTTTDKIIEPVQSRCAILRYSRLSEAQIFKRLLEICAKEKVRVPCLLKTLSNLFFFTAFKSCVLQVAYTDEGLAAVIFTAEGDMRQASQWATLPALPTKSHFPSCSLLAR